MEYKMTISLEAVKKTFLSFVLLRYFAKSEQDLLLSFNDAFQMLSVINSFFMTCHDSPFFPHFSLTRQ